MKELEEDSVVAFAAGDRATDGTLTLWSLILLAVALATGRDVSGDRRCCVVGGLPSHRQRSVALRCSGVSELCSGPALSCYPVVYPRHSRNGHAVILMGEALAWPTSPGCGGVLPDRMRRPPSSGLEAGPNLHG